MLDDRGELRYQYLLGRCRSSLYILEEQISKCSKRFPIPEVLWTGKPIDIGHLRAFGSKFFFRIEDKDRSKFEPKGEAGVFVGYLNGTKREGTKGFAI